MAELLASNIDINGWLPDDKVEANTANTAQLQIDAVSLIRGQLASSFTPVTLASWVGPTATPAQIRSVASRLIAAWLYRKVYSEETTDIPKYAQQIYNEALQMLADIRSGNITVVDVNGVPIDGATEGLSSADFFPNANATAPYFTMDQRFG